MRKQSGISAIHNPYVHIKKSTSGITLIALVVTIIILLILAGVSIATLTGENGILTRASNTKETQRGAEVNEIVLLAVNENQIADYSDDVKKNKTDVVEELFAAGKITEEERDKLLGLNGETEVDKITIGGIEIDFSKLKDEQLLLNEYGFYYGIPYVGNIDGMDVAVIFYDDVEKTIGYYTLGLGLGTNIDDKYVGMQPILGAVYEDGIYKAEDMEFVFSDNGKKVTVYDEYTFVLDENMEIHSVYFDVPYNCTWSADGNTDASIVFNSNNTVTLQVEELSETETVEWYMNNHFCNEGIMITMDGTMALILTGPIVYVFEMNPCTHQNISFKDRLEPTCTNKGHINAEVCDDCSAVISSETTIPANGHTFPEDGYICTVCGAEMKEYYFSPEDYQEKTGINISFGDIIIPDKFQDTNGKWHKVVGIEDNSFQFLDEITSVQIPNTVRYIGAYAFWRCENLNSVTIPNSVENIASQAFGDTGLTNIIFEDNSSLKRIGMHAFKMTQITEITIPASVTDIEGGAFDNSVSLKKVSIESNSNLETIGDSAFSSCYVLESINLEAAKKLKTIGKYAFSSTEIINITIPASVTDIGEGAFHGCDNLSSIIVESGNTSYCIVNEALCTIDKSLLLRYAPAVQGDYTIPSSVKRIGNGAFSGLRNITSVTIPEGIMSIGDNAFNVCESMKTVAIPASVTSIEDGAFWGVYLEKIYYAGTEEDWEKIEFANGWYEEHPYYPYTIIYESTGE